MIRLDFPPRVWIVTTLGLLAAAPALAGPQAVALTVDEAVASGLEASHRLAELQALQEGASASRDRESAGDDPVVSFQADYQRTNHIPEFGVLRPDGTSNVIFPDLPNNYRTRLDLRWPIYSGGRVEALARAATAERDASARDLEAARQDLRLEITRAYWAVLTARESVEVLEGAVERVEAQLRDVRNFLEVGLVPPNEVLTVESERSRQEVLLIEARNRAEVVAADLRRLLGVPAETRLTLTSTLEVPPNAPTAVEALIGEATAARADREALELRAAAARAQRDAAATGLRPTVAIGGGYDYARPNPRFLPREDRWKRSWDATVSLNWRLWDGGRTAAQIAEAGARQRAIAARLRDFDSRLALEVRQRTLDLEAARAAIPAAADAVRSAAEARRVVTERFAAGVATSTDALDAQAVLLRAELGLTRARASARLAEAQLERALGR